MHIPKSSTAKTLFAIASVVFFAVIAIAWTSKSSPKGTGYQPFTLASERTIEPNSGEKCVVRGLYTGTSINVKGERANSIYQFRENNFVVGYHEVSKDGQAFGGYRNTCDSVIFNVNYKPTGAYYLHKGVLSKDRRTISGTFHNLTVPTDYGKFTMRQKSR